MIPAHLAQKTAQGIARDHPIAQFETGTYRNFTYAVLDWNSREALLIDPHSELGPVLEGLRSNGFRLVGIALTHSHWDHVAGLPELARMDLPLWVHDLELSRIDRSVLTQFRVEKITGTRLNAGQIVLEVIPTPGHSAGECSYVFRADRPYLFSGDTLFIRDCGRTDLPTGSNVQMFESLQKLKKLPPETVLLPGHHYAPECASTLGTELETSPPLRCGSVQELAGLP